MLATQSLTLDVMFTSLTCEALKQTNIQLYELFMKLASKAQAQSRCTMEAISKIKNPPHATFVKQQNYAQGPQQVNNYSTNAPESAKGAPQNESDISRTSEFKNAPNELLEADDGERLDIRAKAKTSGEDQAVEALGAINGTNDIGRKKSIEP